MLSDSKKLIRSWPDVEMANLLVVVDELKLLLQRPAVLILTGAVGAGKTSFTQKFVERVLGEVGILSPTYSVLNEHGELLHGDFYRIKELEELIHLELSLYLEHKKYFFIEWGRPFLDEMSRLLESDYHFYELEIEMNLNNKNDSTRDYQLSSYNGGQ